MKKNKKILIFVYAAAAFCAFVAVPANAGLTIIGTGTHADGTHNLVWDDNNGGGTEVVYLDYDYSAGKSVNHPTAIAWASGLDTDLTISLNPGYSVTWDGSWRLPIPNPNELHDLYYSETDHLTVFSNLEDETVNPGYRYWVNNSPTGQIYQISGTVLQHDNPNEYDNGALAVRSGTVTYALPIPAPSAIFLSSIGIGLVGWLRRRRDL